MRARMLGFFVLVASCLSFVAPANADTVIGTFNILNGLASPSGGQVTLILNGNGTIGASLSTTDGTIVDFGINSIDPYLNSNFSSGSPNYNGFISSPASFYGAFQTGYYCNSCGFGSSVTWTIGNVGQFGSVWDALGGTFGTYDFYLRTDANGGNNLWAANAVAVAETPLPAALPLFAGGLGMMVLLARRRKRKTDCAVTS